MINQLTELLNRQSTSHISHPFIKHQTATFNLQVHQCTIKVPNIPQQDKATDLVKAILNLAQLTTKEIKPLAQYTKLLEVEMQVIVHQDLVLGAILQLTTVIFQLFNLNIDNSSSPRYSPTTPNYNTYSPQYSPTTNVYGASPRYQTQASPRYSVDSSQRGQTN